MNLQKYFFYYLNFFVLFILNFLLFHLSFIIFLPSIQLLYSFQVIFFDIKVNLLYYFILIILISIDTFTLVIFLFFENCSVCYLELIYFFDDLIISDYLLLSSV